MPTASASPKRSFGSEAITHGLRVIVTPSFLADRSDPEGLKPSTEREGGRFVFGYRIRIANESQQTVQLMSRRWVIVDSDGERGQVEGDGVVGQQPVLAPGQSFEYSSFCPLPTPWGTMEGEYQFRDALTGELFNVRIARFFLVSPFAGEVNAR
jgi:ApaG protein